MMSLKNNIREKGKSCMVEKRKKIKQTFKKTTKEFFPKEAASCYMRRKAAGHYCQWRCVKWNRNEILQKKKAVPLHVPLHSLHRTWFRGCTTLVVNISCVKKVISVRRNIVCSINLAALRLRRLQRD